MPLTNPLPAVDASDLPARKGRGARTNPPNRFERLHLVEDPAALDEEERRQVETEYFEETAASILSRNESPDLPFSYSINPYRGCEHGCVYCYARPTHEYLGFSAGLDFETKIVVKKNAPDLLAKAFQKPSWAPQAVVLSGNTDPYQPAERTLELTRRCLEVFLRHRNPVVVITKNGLVARDLDILTELARLDLVRVWISLTSLRPEVTGEMEPRSARPSLRLKTVEKLSATGVPVGVNLAPLVPGLTDEEVPAMLAAAAEHGATVAGYGMMRLPGAVKELFIDWLGRTFPERKTKVLRRLRDLWGEDLTEHRFGERMRGQGEWARLLRQLFEVTCRKEGLERSFPPPSTAHFRPLRKGQLGLF